MGFWDWLFGAGGDGQEGGQGGADMIEVLDEEGEEMRVPRQKYADEVLPKQLEQAGDDPEALYGTLRRALDEGFAEECLEAARRLRDIDDNPERGATILGLTYWKLDRLEDAEQVYRDYIDEHGESAIVSTNLAKIHAERDETERAKEVL
ncbi:MAG: tetratricopeptide repeat protein, partial [Bradymonadaceae bacterium]